jgi:hypothetical protein
MKVSALLLGAMVVAAGSCGSPAKPTSIQVAGTWTGSWKFVTAGVTVTDTVTATLTQSAFSVSGTWTSAGGASGTLSFAVDASFVGSMSIVRTLLTGTVCSANSTISGSAEASNLQFAAASFSGTGLCQWATDNRFTLTK